MSKIDIVELWVKGINIVTVLLYLKESKKIILILHRIGHTTEF